MIGHIIAANVDHQRLVFDFISDFRRGAMTASVALPSLLTTVQADRLNARHLLALHVYRYLWIKMPACGFRGAGFAIFGGGWQLPLA